LKSALLKGDFKEQRLAHFKNKTETAGHRQKPIHELIGQFAEARRPLIRRIETIDEATASIQSLHPACKNRCGWCTPCFSRPNTMTVS
jgi:hypothetical protein